LPPGAALGEYDGYAVRTGKRFGCFWFGENRRLCRATDFSVWARLRLVEAGSGPKCAIVSRPYNWWLYVLNGRLAFATLGSDGVREDYFEQKGPELWPDFSDKWIDVGFSIRDSSANSAERQLLVYLNGGLVGDFRVQAEFDKPPYHLVVGANGAEIDPCEAEFDRVVIMTGLLATNSESLVTPGATPSAVPQPGVPEQPDRNSPAFVAGLRNAFSLHDKNADGRLSRAEAPPTMRDKGFQQFNEFDTNHDGTISIEEWISAWTRTGPQAPNRANRSLPGKWRGQLANVPSGLRLSIEIARRGSVWGGQVLSLDQGNAPSRITSVSWNDESVHIEIASIQSVFDGKWSEDGSEIVGEWKQRGITSALTLRRDK